MKNDTSNIHYMNLHPTPFTLVQSGSKTIELRLFDEKRKLIQIGDTIVFTNTGTNETIKAEVLNLYKYKSFTELYKYHNKISMGYNEGEIASPDDMLLYYTEEQIKAFGVVGIEIKTI